MKKIILTFTLATSQLFANLPIFTANLASEIDLSLDVPTPTIDEIEHAILTDKMQIAYDSTLDNPDELKIKLRPNAYAKTWFQYVNSTENNDKGFPRFSQDLDTDFSLKMSLPKPNEADFTAEKSTRNIDKAYRLALINPKHNIMKFNKLSYFGKELKKLEEDENSSIEEYENFYKQLNK